MRKAQVDTSGAILLVLVSALLGFNQVLIKVGNGGFGPVFFAGLRSAGAMVCIWAWLKYRGHPLEFSRATLPAGVLLGSIFAAEFVFLFLALDLTSVSRASVIFYTMPMWLALGGHFLLPGESLTGIKMAGLALAFAGVTWAIVDRPTGGQASLLGDLLALLAAIGWAAIALCTRLTALKDIGPETQLMWQVTVSAVILLVIAPFFGPLLRDPGLIHWGTLAVQIIIIATATFMLWLWLLKIYPANAVGAFGFLSPIFGVGFGWLLLGETVGWQLIASLALVIGGLVLITRRPAAPKG